MSTMLARIDTEAFGEAVEEAAGAVAVEFTAAWCPPCRVLAPALERVASELAGRITVVTVDADVEVDLVARYAVRGLPTILFFADGRLVDRLVGAVPYPALRRRFEANAMA